MRCIPLLLVALPLCLSYTWEQGETDKPGSRCPGLFCGREDRGEERGNGSLRFSTCGPCPRGSRALASACSPCTSPPHLYDWLYLGVEALLHPLHHLHLYLGNWPPGFVALFTLLAHWVAIDLAASHRRLSKELLMLHGAALLEVVVSALGTLLLASPRGSLALHACPVQGLADWYPLLHNPSPNYGPALHCTHETVYPRFSIVFVFLGLCLVTMVLVRPFLASRLLPGRGRNSVYAALYFLPILGLVHAVLGGLVYYTYPYITLLSSLFSCAAHFAFKLDQSLRSLVASSFTDSRNLTILLGHWALHAYGILAITELRQSVHLSLLALVPLPALFYILTARSHHLRLHLHTTSDCTSTPPHTTHHNAPSHLTSPPHTQVHRALRFTDPARINNINELN